MNPIKQEAMFKVGCCYRQKNGQVVRLYPGLGSQDEGWAKSVDGTSGFGQRRLNDGTDTLSFELFYVGDRTLLPGECDESGNLIESPKPVTLGQILRQALERQSTPLTRVRLENTAEPKRDQLAYFNEKTPSFADKQFPGFTVKKSAHRQEKSSGYSPDLFPTGTRPDFRCGSAHLIGGEK